MKTVFMEVKMKPGFEKFAPKQAHPGDAGFDIYACIGGDSNSDRKFVLYPGERVHVDCGFSMAIPKGYEAQMRPRSGLALKKGITLLNSPGTIDSGYRGEVGAIVINHGGTPFVLSNGDRIAQIVIAEIPEVRMMMVSELPASERGQGGFGSTGVSTQADARISCAHVEMMNPETCPLQGGVGCEGVENESL